MAGAPGLAVAPHPLHRSALPRLARRLRRRRYAYAECHSDPQAVIQLTCINGARAQPLPPAAKKLVACGYALLQGEAAAARGATITVFCLFRSCGAFLDCPTPSLCASWGEAKVCNLPAASCRVTHSDQSAAAAQPHLQASWRTHSMQTHLL